MDFIVPKPPRARRDEVVVPGERRPEHGCFGGFLPPFKPIEANAVNRIPKTIFTSLEACCYMPHCPDTARTNKAPPAINLIHPTDIDIIGKRSTGVPVSPASSPGCEGRRYRSFLHQ